MADEFGDERLDLVIDDPDTEQALARLGFPLWPASVRVCHWQPYLRPGLFALYRALLFIHELQNLQLQSRLLLVQIQLREVFF